MRTREVPIRTILAVQAVCLAIVAVAAGLWLARGEAADPLASPGEFAYVPVARREAPDDKDEQARYLAVAYDQAIAVARRDAESTNLLAVSLLLVLIVAVSRRRFSATRQGSGR